MLLLVYTLAALLALGLLHRFVCRLSRGAAVFLFFLPFLLVGSALIRGRVYAPVDKIYMDIPLSEVRGQQGIGDPHNPATADIVSQMIPWRHAVREAYARGEWPLWNPYILSGDILAAAAQPAPYSPFTLIALLLPPPISFTFTAAMAFLVAAMGAFAFARELGCRESAAAIAAAGFTYSAGISLYVLWPLGLCWALLPLVLLGARRVVYVPSMHAWALLTVALVLLILAGHPESVLHIVAIGAVYGVFEKGWRLAVGGWRAIGVAVAAGIAALLLCAIFLLPYIEAVPQTAEYPFRLTFKDVDRSAPAPQVLVTLAGDLFPALHLRKWTDLNAGLHGESAAVGSIILALAVYAVWRVRTRTTWFFAAMTVVLLLAHAGWGPVSRLMHALPLFDIAFNERLAFGVAAFLALLAAIGVEEIARRDDRRAAAFTMLVVLLVLGIGTWWITRTFAIEPGPRDWGEHTVLAELVFLGVAAVCVAFRPSPGATRHPLPASGARGDGRGRMRGFSFLLILLLLLAQRLLTVGGVHESFPAEAAYPAMKIFEPMKNVGEPFRIAGTGWALVPGTNALYGLEDVRGYEAMTFAPYFKTYPLWCTHQPVFFNRVDDLSKPFLSLMNVRFAFDRASSPVPPGWQVVAREGEAVLLENTNVLPRAFVPRSVSIGMHSDIVLEEMRTVSDFRERAWIGADVPPIAGPNASGSVNLRRAPRGYVLDANMDADGWVVVTTNAWKGWRAYVDDRRIRLQRANIAFLGVHVPKGRHEVRLVYWPESFVIGRGISLATLVLIAAGCAWWVARRS